jgi:predicted O-linked N-acetylglucosamine transferase (SPINDLY family)
MKPRTGEQAMRARIDAIRRAAAAGRVAEALRDASALCIAEPSSVDAARLHAMLTTHAGSADAEAAWARLLDLAPGDAEAHFQLGNAAGDRGDFAAAVRHLDAARARLPRHAVLLNNLGLALEASGDLSNAALRFGDAMAADPRAGTAVRPSLARVLFRAGRYAEALPHIDLLLTGDGRDASWQAARAVCLAALGRDDQALAAYRHAIALDPSAAPVWHDLVRWLLSRGRFEEAHAMLEEAHAALPGDTLLQSLLLASRQRFADWRDLPALRDALTASVADPRWSGTASGYDFIAVADDPALQRRVAERYAASEGAGLPVAPRAGTDTSAPTTARHASPARLRLGFVSSDYRDHPVGRLVVALLERLDRTRFDVIAYTTGPAGDVTGARLAAAGAGPHALARRDVTGAVNRLRADAIDVLFDLNGFSGGEALRIFAARPAPLQVNFLGYTGTLGSSAYDRIVTDRYCIPPQASGDYLERPLYVEPCYLPSDPARAHDAPPSRSAYGLPDEAIVLYAGSVLYKLTPEMFGAWMRVLRDAAGTVLWLRDAPGSAQERLRAAAREGGVDAARIVFAPAEPLGRYLARLALADAFLDTTPFGAHTTVNDALFMGVPVVTLAGRSFAARASASQVTAAGLGDLVARDLPGYVDTACALARDGARRSVACATLASARTGPLFDADRYAAAFADAVLAAWNER